jgi:NAD(P)-dependent dehydrogenase (short-subunit alcohol dehydrogenase family)
MSDRKVALVTGGSSGIGAAILARLDGLGWYGVNADTKPPPEGAPGQYHHADVADETAVRLLVEEIGRAHGRLDGLVCNAGIMIRRPLEELSLADWWRVLNTNLTSAFLLARAAAPMLRQSRGAIVTIASSRAHMSEPDTESYSASKGGLLALTHALAISLGPAVRCNCVSPGWINTRGDTLRRQDNDQHPAGRVGTPDDVARLIGFLLDDEAGFATGAEFILDGGMTRKMIYQDS